MAARAQLVDHFLAPVFDNRRLFALLCLKHDCQVAGVVLLLQIAGWRLRLRSLSIALHLAVALILAIDILDLAVFALFSQRLSLNNFLRFDHEGSAMITIALDFIADWKYALITAAAASTLIGGFAAARRHNRLGWRGSVMGVLGSVVLIGVYAWPAQIVYTNDWTYRNVFEIGATSGVLTSYSPAMLEAGRAWAEAQDRSRRCVQAMHKRRNVILVVMESLSTHHSQYLSGLSDWTPKIDAIARKNYSYTDFYANGNNTAFGLIALLTGHTPILALNVRNYGRYRGVDDALPIRLRKSGYESAFLTTGTLGFLSVGQWLTSIGFDYVEGDEAPFYQGMERFNFHAAADEQLYARSLQWMQQKKGPLFLTLLTVSTHPPYMNPLTKERSEEASFRYADQAFAKFVEMLSERAFFANGGILLLTGDHHDMVPLQAAEIAKFGNSADARVPLLVLGEGLGLPRQVSGPYQQADIPTSIENMAGERACFKDREADLFHPSPSASERCILHQRGDVQDVVDEFCGSQFGQVKLDGDATRALKGSIANQEALIREINAERIGWFLRRQADGTAARQLPAPL